VYSNCLLKDFITKEYKNVVNEEPQHLSDVNFRVLVRGVGIVDSKVSTWMVRINWDIYTPQTVESGNHYTEKES
jgi:hypothetical protein